MSELTPVPMSPSEGPAALAVNKACPIEADFTFYFERDPDFFLWPRTVFDDFHYFAVHDEDQLVAYAMVAEKEGWVGDGWGTFGYGGDARVLPDYRRRGIADSLLLTINANMPDAVDVGFSIMKVGNRPVEQYVEKLERERRNPDWDGSPLGVFRALNVFFIPLADPPEIMVRRANLADVIAIVDLQQEQFEGRLFAPRPSADRVEAAIRDRQPADVPMPHYWVAEQGGEVVGTLAFWNIDQMHRPRVLERSWRAKFSAIGYGALRLAHPNLVPLPEEGGVFRGLSAIDLAMRDRDPAILRAMLDATLRHYSNHGLHYLQLGCMRDDPLQEAFEDFRCVRFESNLGGWFRKSWRDRVPPDALADPYVDLTLL